MELTGTQARYLAELAEEQNSDPAIMLDMALDLLRVYLADRTIDPDLCGSLADPNDQL